MAPNMKIIRFQIYSKKKKQPILLMLWLMRQSPEQVQVNLFQKPSFLHQLTHNMTRDCSLNSPKNTHLQHVVYKNCVLFLFWHSNNIFCKLVFFGEFNEQFLVILWVNWCKNKSFWQRFTCIAANPKSSFQAYGGREITKTGVSIQPKGTFKLDSKISLGSYNNSDTPKNGDLETSGVTSKSSYSSYSMTSSSSRSLFK